MPQVPNNLKFGMPMMVVSLVTFGVIFWGFAQLIGEPAKAAPQEVVEDSGGGGGGPSSVTVVAKNLQFDKRNLSASAGAAFTITLNNQDPGVSHNIAFFTSRAATAPLVPDDAKTPLAAGVSQQTVTFTPARAGNFFFRCDAHPDMNGSFVVR